jgi:hypothetical protein
VKIYLLEATKENMPVILQCSKQQNDTTGGGTVTSNLVQIMVSIRRIQRKLLHKKINAQFPKELIIQTTQVLEDSLECQGLSISSL